MSLMGPISCQTSKPVLKTLPSPPRKTTYEKGVNAFQQKKWVQALSFFAPLAKEIRHPHRLKIILYLAEIYAHLHKPQLILDLFEHHPLPPSHQGLECAWRAEALWLLNKRLPALDLIQRAVALRPFDSALTLKKLWWSAQVDQGSEVPDPPFLHDLTSRSSLVEVNLYIWHLMRQGDYRLALKKAKSILKTFKIDLDPYNMESINFWRLCGTMHIKLGSWDKARAIFDRILQVKPFDPDTLYWVGMLQRQEKPEKAIEVFRSLIRILPDDPRAYRELGFLFKNKEPLIAQHYFKMYLKLSARSHIHKEKYQKELQFIRKTLRDLQKKNPIHMAVCTSDLDCQ